MAVRFPTSSSAAGVDFVIYQVDEFEHISDAYCHRAIAAASQ
ncbi:hypothetical protein QUA11_31965 [Microcoleus sp. S13_D1]